MTIQTEARNASLQDLAGILTAQRECQADAVVSATAMRSVGGVIYVTGVGVPSFENATMDDVFDTTPSAGGFLPTAIADGHFAEKLRIPVAYLRRLRETRSDLYDANVNGWLHGHGDEAAADSRNFLARTFVDPEGGVGIFRALLSDSFGRYDNLDFITAALTGLRESGIEAQITRCDLSETRMSIHLAAPAMAVWSEGPLLDGYRPTTKSWDNPTARAAALAAVQARYGPHHGFRPGTEPIVYAGLRLGNSETGNGRLVITPELTGLSCSNGYTVTRDAVARTHLGARMDEGINYSVETQRKNLDLISAMTSDAIATFLSREYVEDTMAKIHAKAGVELKDPGKTVQLLGKAMAFTEAETDGILAHFIQGGQMTSGGVLNAITAYAQDPALSPDAAHELESKAIEAMEFAAAL